MFATQLKVCCPSSARSARAQLHRSSPCLSLAASRPTALAVRAQAAKDANHAADETAPAPEQQQIAKQQTKAAPVLHSAGLPVLRLPPVFRQMQQELHAMTNMFDEVFGSQLANPFTTTSSNKALQLPAMLHLATDIEEDDKAIIIKADCPGMDKPDIKVSVLDGTLTISGERKEEKREGEEGKSPVRYERSYGSFRRNFSLPPNVDADAITASAKDGVLTVTLPKVPEPEAPQPKEVQVQ